MVYNAARCIKRSVKAAERCFHEWKNKRFRKHWFPYSSVITVRSLLFTNGSPNGNRLSPLIGLKQQQEPFLALAPAPDDFEGIIKVRSKCCSGIFYMQREAGMRPRGEERPEILITAGITAPRASLSVQQCNHQPSTCNAQVGAASPGEGAVMEVGGGGGRGQGRGLSGCRTDG